jgi:hypothetical protein
MAGHRARAVSRHRPEAAPRVRQCRILTRDVYGARPLWNFCEPYIAACLFDKLPDALVFANVRRSDVVLRALSDAASAATALRAGYGVSVITHQLGHSNGYLVWSRYGRLPLTRVITHRGR